MLRVTTRKFLHQISGHHVNQWLTALGMGAALGILTLGWTILSDARQDVWHQAERASGNLALALEQDIARQITIYDLSIQGASTALTLAGIGQVSPEIRQMALFDRAASAEYLGAVVVLDTTGKIIADSTSITPHEYNLRDRDYFRIHEDRSDAGLFISRPVKSRLRGDMMIAMSRRISRPDGSFGGVLMGSLRLAYFQDLFAKLDLGAKGSVALVRADGRMIMRRPLHQEDIDRDLGDVSTFREYAATPSGTSVSTSTLDGVERLNTFRHVGNLPLILVIGIATDDIYAVWWRKAVAIGLALAALTGATLALCLLSRREITRRTQAEHALVQAAEQLLIMAGTDGLTGLANRRSLDDTLTTEWRRTMRSATSIAVMMLDVDWFKLFNDTYGHPEGDRVLQAIAKCIGQTVLRPPDMAGRYGGEEFLALLPETELSGAVIIAERIRVAVEDLNMPHAASPNRRVTLSIGVAVAYPGHGDEPSCVVKQADEALYAAKRAGRNRVAVASGTHPPVAVWEPTRLDAVGPLT
jgi:diguanylate cyclase (GGDEF)-like protein